LLAGATVRLVGRPSELFEETFDLPFGIGDPKLDPDHLLYPAACPNGASATIRFRTPFQERGELGQLFSTQPSRRSRDRLGAKGFHTVGVRSFQPLAHRSLSHSKSLGDGGLLPPSLVEFPSSEATSFFRVGSGS